jgi:hypothetical protein
MTDSAVLFDKIDDTRNNPRSPPSLHGMYNSKQRTMNFNDSSNCWRGEKLHHLLRLSVCVSLSLTHLCVCVWKYWGLDKGRHNTTARVWSIQFAWRWSHKLWELLFKKNSKPPGAIFYPINATPMQGSIGQKSNGFVGFALIFLSHHTFDLLLAGVALFFNFPYSHARCCNPLWQTLTHNHERSSRPAKL